MLAALILPVAGYCALQKARLMGQKLRTEALLGAAGWFSIASIAIIGCVAAFQNYMMLEQTGD
jgi:hypothetical protein